MSAPQYGNMIIMHVVVSSFEVFWDCLAQCAVLYDGLL